MTEDKKVYLGNEYRTNVELYELILKRWDWNRITQMCKKLSKEGKRNYKHKLSGKWSAEELDGLITDLKNEKLEVKLLPGSVILSVSW